MSNHVSADELAVHLVVSHGVRTRPYDAHGAFQDVEELWKLIQGARAQDSAKRRYTVVRLRGLGNHGAVLTDRHAAKLVDDDFLAVQTVTALLEENRSTRSEFDRQCEQDHQGREQSQADTGQNDVGHAL